MKLFIYHKISFYHALGNIVQGMANLLDSIILIISFGFISSLIGHSILKLRLVNGFLFDKKKK